VADKQLNEHQIELVHRIMSVRHFWGSDSSSSITPRSLI